MMALRGGLRHDGRVKPMLATRGDHVPTGTDWTHEVKWDGMRVLVEHTPGRGLRVWSRNENDVSVSFPELQGLQDVLPPGTTIDGEVVALGDGVPSFGALADRMHVRDAARARRLAEAAPVTLLVFDLVRLAGEEVAAEPLSRRRERLFGLGLEPTPGNRGAWQVPPQYDDGPALLDAAGQQGLEGIVSKRLSSAYRPGRRSRDWLKFPIRPTGSYVVGGFRWETGSQHRLGALLVGEPGPGGLVYRGRVGSGVAGKAGVVLAELLAPIRSDLAPFADEVPRVDRLGTEWVEPSVVVDVQYLRLTDEGRLRQPAYRGVRRDLSPGDLDPGDL